MKKIGNKKITLEEFILKANIKHNHFFNYSKTIIYSKNRIVNIICPIHGEFKISKYDHLNGIGCKKCNREKEALQVKENLIDKADKIHNKKYDYSLIKYINSKIKVEIICPIHGKFEQRLIDHANGRGCNKCSGGTILSKEECIEKLNKFKMYTHYFYNENDIIDSSTPLKFICRHCAEEIFRKPLINNYEPIHKKCISIKLKEQRVNTNQDEFILYRQKVRDLSNQNYIKYYYQINPNNLKRGSEYHLDHIISIHSGFHNNIEPEIIAAPENLRIISKKENISKGIKSEEICLIINKNKIKITQSDNKKHLRKKYIIIDLLSNEKFEVDNIDIWCKERNIKTSSLVWASNYNKNKIYKNRYHIIKL